MPPVGVDARSRTDIQAAVNFAREHNLKLVVMSTGHDLLGRSTAHGSFLIWTHRMKDMSYNSTFVPEGAPVTSLMVIAPSSFRISGTYKVFQLLLLELVFNGMKHISSLRNKGGPLLEVWIQVELLVLLEDG